MKKKINLKPVYLVVLMLFVVAACAPTAPNTDNNANAQNVSATIADTEPATDIPAPQPTDVPQDSAANPTDAPTTQPETQAPVITSEDCPKTNNNLVSFIHPGHGYCFLIPSGYTPDISSNSVQFTGAIQGDIEYYAVTLRIIVEPANGRTTETVAAAASQSIGVGETPTSISMGNYQALLLKNIPGRFASANSFLVYNDLLYTFIVDPIDIDDPNSSPLPDDARLLWNTLANTIALFDPQTAAQPQANTENCEPGSTFVSDVNIPDGTLIQPGESVMKRWKIRNTGTCDWGVGYELFQRDVSATVSTTAFMADTFVINLPLTAPGEEVVINIRITLAGAAAPGDHLAEFAMRTPSGESFGATPFALVKVASNSSQSPTQPPQINSPNSPLTDCPVAGGWQYWYKDDFVGVCFVYLIDNAIVENLNNTTLRVTIPTDPTCNCDAVPVVLEIIRIGDASNLTLQEFANQQIALWENPVIAPTISTTTVGGYPAIVADGLGLPAMFGTREAYLIANGIGYTLRHAPEDMELALWNQIVLGQIHFFDE